MKMHNTSHLTIILHLLGSLAILLCGLEILSSSLQKLNKEKIAKFLLKFSKTPARGIVTGTVATALLDSSSVTIILLIAFVDSGLINFSNSIGVVLGANIGTTISSQIIAFNIGQYAAIGLFIGVLGNLFLKKARTKFYFNVILGFSLIFYGLHLMETAVYHYRESSKIISWMVELKNPFYGAAIGALVTAIIQSSSATIGIAIVLTSQGILGLEGGIVIMLGAEIGTCLDTLISSIGRKKEAVRLGIFHLGFNVISVIFGLIFFSYLLQITIYLAPEATLERKLANAHLVFNCLSVLIYFLILTFYRHKNFFHKNAIFHSQ